MDFTESKDDDLPVMPSTLRKEHQELLDAEKYIAVTTENEETGVVSDQGKFTPAHVEPGEFSVLPLNRKAFNIIDFAQKHRYLLFTQCLFN